MPVRINLHQFAVEAKVSGAFDKALPLLTNEIRADCNEYCKKADGGLYASALSHSILKDGLIIWQTAYARRQYWEIRTAYKTVNPNATWRWCEYAKQRHLAKWREQAERLLRMNI